MEMCAIWLFFIIYKDVFNQSCIFYSKGRVGDWDKGFSPNHLVMSVHRYKAVLTMINAVSHGYNADSLLV